jgi:hypothetical protein
MNQKPLNRLFWHHSHGICSVYERKNVNLQENGIATEQSKEKELAVLAKNRYAQAPFLHGLMKLFLRKTTRITVLASLCDVKAFVLESTYSCFIICQLRCLLWNKKI